MRRGLAFLTLLGLVLIFTLDGSAQPGKKGGGASTTDGVITNWGQPKAFAGARDKVNAYWLWYDDGIWHLRTTGGGRGAHRFNGKIEVIGGQLVALKGQKGDFRGKLADRAVFTRTAIAFDFKTDEGVDGFNFAVDPAATELRFSLAFDGEASPKHIRIGRNSDHPAGAVFTLPARPNDPPEGKAKKGKAKSKK